MSRKVSVSITLGRGSEQHNHDLEYRSTLSHVHERQNGVIELVPYQSYEKKINELMKPYIDDYNHKQQERYMAAWERYNRGEIKTKPRKANYKPMSYDYYAEHKDDIYYNRATGCNETLPMFRSIIFGLGDRSDRQTGMITEAEAVTVITNIVNRWSDMFPDFKLLGASIHLDEEGFYHAHIDYKPLFEKDVSLLKQEQGLNVSVSQEAALEHMGFEPEQSVINGRDKVPIRFNAFRNKLYFETEAELNKLGLRLWYNASKDKEPYKDSSKNQRLENWQATKDGVDELQRMKNTMLDVVEGDRVSPDGYKEIIKAAQDLNNTLDVLDEQKRSRLNKDHVLVSFGLFDQLRSFIKNIVSTISHLLQNLDIAEENLEYETDRADRLQDEVDRLKPLKKYDTPDFRVRQEHLEKLARRCQQAEQENRELKRRLGIDKNNSRGLF